MVNVKIFGAGSIGNHLAHASRELGWNVVMCDLDEAALMRSREQIYPSRYGAWDTNIRQFLNHDAPVGEYDYIFIGTPPEFHIPLAFKALEEKPKAILVEKPFCCPDLSGAQSLFTEANKANIAIFTGYDHVVGKAACQFIELAKAFEANEIETLDVEFREYWGGIFAAHPWLDGPKDSYLGYWERGGGASGEHSHALNLWQHFAHMIGAGKVVEVQASLSFVCDQNVDYDKLCLLQLKTENGLIGRVVQDVVTSPVRKWARLQAIDNFIEWHCSYQSGVDAVFFGNRNGIENEFLFEKTRPDDFICELQHIQSVISKPITVSPISIERGLDTMLVLAAAHKSHQEQRNVSIDYTNGYTEKALN